MNCETNPKTGGTSYEMFAALKEISERGQLLVNITEGNQTSLMTGMFDLVIEKLADGQEIVNYKMKMPTDLTIQPTGPNGEIYWKETVTLEPQADVAIAGTAQNTVKVDDIKNLLGIWTGATLIVEQPVGVKIVDVLSVSGNTITLAVGQTITTVVGQKVYRGAYGIAPNCNVKASNGYTLPGFAQKFAYGRRLYVTYNFNVDDFNIDRASYNYGKSAQDHLSSLMKAGNLGAQREFINTIWFDQNVKEGDTLLNGSTATYKQTMGIVPAIHKAQTSTNKRLIKDYTTGTAAAGETLNVTRVRDFMNEIKNAIHSRVYDDTKKINVYCNTIQSDALIELNKYFSEYKGVTIWENGIQDSHDFSSFTLKIGVYTVDFLYEPALDKMAPKEAVYVILPVKHIHFVQKPFSTMNLSGTDAKLVGPNTVLSAGMPVFKFVDRTDQETNGEGDCAVYRAFMDYAILLGALETGAWRMGYGFRSTTDICNALSTSGTLTLIS